MSERRELLLYLGAAAAYVALGVAFPVLLFSWFEGAAFLLLAVWLLPAGVARVLRRVRAAGGAPGDGEGRA